MKIRYEDKENISNSSENSRKFKLSEDAEATLNIIQILTENLYTNPKRSAIRETLANAIDASVEKIKISKSNKKPRIDIYITNDKINNSFLYFLNIKDYGIGINEERMENYISKIGNSSKRDTDSQIGVLGIGICTLFCIGEQVFIESYITDDTKRTERIKYLLYKDEVGIPCYDLKEKEYIGEKIEESNTVVKILLEGEEILNIVLKYILENCYLTDIDLYTNIKSLILISSYVEKYKYNYEKFKHIEMYYMFKKSNNIKNNYYYDSLRFKKGNYEEEQYLNRFLNIERELSKEEFKNNLSNYHCKSNFDNSEESYIKKLLSSEGVLEEDEIIIIMMGDSLYSLKIDSLINIFKGKISPEDFDIIKSLKYINTQKESQLVLRVPIGAIKFSSNREYIIIENENTQQYLLNCIKEFFESYKKEFFKKLENYNNISIENLFELSSYARENNFLLNIKGLIIENLKLKILTYPESTIYNNSFEDINLWEEKLNEEDLNNNKILVIDKYDNTFKLINDNIINNTEETKSNLKDKRYLQVEDIYNKIFDYNAFLIGPTKGLKLNKDINNKLSKSIKENSYIKKKLSLLFSDCKISYIERKKIIKEIIELNKLNKLKIVISNYSQVSKIRNQTKEIKNDEPFILIVQKNEVIEKLKESIAFKLTGAILCFNKKSKEKKEDKNSNNIKENIDSRPFNSSILLSRIYDKEKLNKFVKSNRYNENTIYDLTKPLKKNIEKENKLRRIIIYELSSSQKVSTDYILEHWFIEKLLEYKIIKNEENKINNIIFLTETSFNYIKEKLSKYRLKSVRKIYNQILNIIYKKNKKIINKLISLNSSTTRIYNSRIYNFVKSRNILYKYSEMYCLLGQIENILRENNKEATHSIYELNEKEIVKKFQEIFLESNFKDLNFKYEYTEETYIFDKLLYKLVNNIRSLKSYIHEVGQVNIIYWLYEEKNPIEELNVIDILIEYNEVLLDKTGLIKDFYKKLIESIIKGNK